MEPGCWCRRSETQPRHQPASHRGTEDTKIDPRNCSVSSVPLCEKWLAEELTAPAVFWRASWGGFLANVSSRMNIHEYQAKELFAKYGVPVPQGMPAKSPEDFVNALAQLPEGPTMVKSQIHAGGRGKGAFTDGFKGGVKFCKTKAEAREAATRMLGNTLVTIQTGPAGRKVQTIYFTVASEIKKEYYLAILLDRATSKPVIVASTERSEEHTSELQSLRH